MNWLHFLNKFCSDIVIVSGSFVIVCITQWQTYYEFFTNSVFFSLLHSWNFPKNLWILVKNLSRNISSVNGSKALLLTCAPRLNVAVTLRAVLAGQNSSNTNQMAPSLAAQMVCTHYEFEIRSLCGGNACP